MIKTTDGGKIWSYTGLRDTPAYMYGLALDAATPDHIFAGGTIANPNAWALWESFDGGETWKEIPPADAGMMSLAITGISSIVADPSRPGVIYIATYGHGVWKYESPMTGVDDPDDSALPKGLVLEQNYPNSLQTSVFNAGTTIRFTIPPALTDVSTNLAIYNLRGELVRELLNRHLPAGNHGARWDGKDDSGCQVASGIYFYRLNVGNVVEMRKLSLLK